MDGKEGSSLLGHQFWRKLYFQKDFRLELELAKVSQLTKALPRQVGLKAMLQYKQIGRP